MEHQVSVQRNSVGTAGFILAVVAIVLCWIPLLNFILWLIGAVLSVVGLFKQPRGLAIAGTILSFLGIVIGIILVAALGVSFAALG